MKVAVIGANGQLGTDVVRAFEKLGDEVIRLTHAEIELSAADSVTSSLVPARPDIIVNTAAMHHVENCEERPDRAFAVNAVGVRNLANVASDLGAVLVHVSTDYVFDGGKRDPYVESDLPRPLNVYGTSKLAGEYFARTIAPRHFVLRTSALYGAQPCRAKGGRNFIDLMMKLANERGKVRVVDSETVTPTATPELAAQIVRLSRTDAYGLYHATAEGSCSWFEFAREIFSLAGLRVTLEVAAPDEFPAKVPRPSYSVLENLRLNSQGLSVFRPWQAGLRSYLEAKYAAATS